jgi:hypothetical protein
MASTLERDPLVCRALGMRDRPTLITWSDLAFDLAPRLTGATFDWHVADVVAMSVARRASAMALAGFTAAEIAVMAELVLLLPLAERWVFGGRPEVTHTVDYLPVAGVGGRAVAAYE